MPTLPVAQSATIGVVPVRVVNAGARPLIQSITAFIASFSFGAPSVGQPSEWPVPGFSACMTAKPRGSQALSNVVAIFGDVFLVAKFGWNGRVGGVAPISRSTDQLLLGPRLA